MKIIKSSFEYVNPPDYEKVIKTIELCGRTCYKSEDKITPESAERFIRGVIKSGHTSVLEHEKVTVKVICDRGISHEIVRHRLASYSQESSRYVSYAKDKFGNEITVIAPCFWDSDSDQYKIWKGSCEIAEAAYFNLLKQGAKPEEARSVLPNSLKTEIAITMNFREWRHFFTMRLSQRAHPQMREIAKKIYDDMSECYPVLFENLFIQET